MVERPDDSRIRHSHQPLLLAQALLLTGKAHVIIMESRHLTSPSPACTACGSTSRVKYVIPRPLGGVLRSLETLAAASHTISSRRSPSKSRKMVSIECKQTGGLLPSAKGKQLRRVARETSSTEDCHHS